MRTEETREVNQERKVESFDQLISWLIFIWSCEDTFRGICNWNDGMVSCDIKPQPQNLLAYSNIMNSQYNSHLINSHFKAFYKDHYTFVIHVYVSKPYIVIEVKITDLVVHCYCSLIYEPVNDILILHFNVTTFLGTENKIFTSFKL